MESSRRRRFALLQDLKMEIHLQRARSQVKDDQSKLALSLDVLDSQPDASSHIHFPAEDRIDEYRMHPVAR